MTRRYEIHEIVSQDEEGVIFHAIDRETGEEVAVRRFFPFGAAGGGLEDEEIEAYQVAVLRLAAIDHPALRPILTGGTDPIDGMPYLVTRWIDGLPLAERLREGPLSPLSARALAEAALEASEVLAGVFGEDAVWVDTHPASITLYERDGDTFASFWISPLRWLGSPAHGRSLSPLMTMVEEITGWKNQVVSGQSGDGLGAWIKQVRQHADDWSLAQARQALQPGAEPAPAAPTPPAAAAAPPPAPAVVIPKGNAWPWVMAGLLFLAVGGLMVWKGRTPPPEPAMAAPPAEAVTVAAPEPDTPTPAPTDRPEPAEERSMDEVNRRALELARARAESLDFAPGQQAELEGVVIDTEIRSAGRRLFVRFRPDRPSNVEWAAVNLADLPDDLAARLESPDRLRARFQGSVRFDRFAHRNFIDVRLPDGLDVAADESATEPATDTPAP